MYHDIQIILDNAGNINLRIDDWYHQYTIEDVKMCVSDILEKQYGHLADHWTDVIDGHESELESDWAELEDSNQCTSISQSLELRLLIDSNRAAEALRTELAERRVSF